MQRGKRNSYVYEGWELAKVADPETLNTFDCGHADLNQYFREEVIPHRQELLSETYRLKEATVEEEFPVALISLCNDAVRGQSVFQFLGLPKSKSYPFYPAVKITRFGVQNEFRRQDIGTHVMNMIKRLFLTDNRTGCRLLTVDALNDQDVLNFYVNRNDFQFITNKDRRKRQRVLFFDLKRLQI